jgi:periplasmic divalent cation tolerance protein
LTLFPVGRFGREHLSVISGSADKAVVLVTTASREEAERIARLLLERRSVACVNIVPGVQSLFWWQGNLDSAQESLLIAKTRMSLVARVVDLVRGAHSYTIPEVIALPIVVGNDDYLEWIDRETDEG